MSSDYQNPYTQVVVAQPLSSEELPHARYRALNGLAVASLVCGVLSILTFLSSLLLVVPAAAIGLGWLALRQIRRNPEEAMGAGVAWAGMALAVLLSSAGYAWTVYHYYYSVPEGYELITYPMLQPDGNDPERRVSSDAEMLDKRKVFIRGFMAPSKQQSGIKEFMLIDDRGACSFCAPTPRPTQVIRVKLAGALKATYTTRLLGVGGEFTIHTDPKEEGFSGIVYQIDADCLR